MGVHQSSENIALQILTSTFVTVPGECLASSSRNGRSFVMSSASSATETSASCCFARWTLRSDSFLPTFPSTAFFSFGPEMLLSARTMF